MLLAIVEKNIIIHRFLSQSSAFQANPLIVRHWEGASELLAFFVSPALRGTLYFMTARVLQAQRKRETNYPRQMKLERAANATRSTLIGPRCERG